jgi:hypothetical protein
MKRIKHSKYKNTGLIFELLVRQVASDTMHNKDSKALRIIKKHFSKNSELSKELKLYRSLYEEKFTNERKAELFLDAVLLSRRQINETQLRREKYNLVKEIKNLLDSQEFFNARISTYTQHAAIYRLFEFTEADDPRGYVDNKIALIEHIQCQNKNEVKPILISEDKDIRILASRMVVDKFNEKYANLNSSQKRMLREYINNVTNSSNLKTYIINETTKLETEIRALATAIPSKIVRIKLNEVIGLLGQLRQKRNIQDKEIVTMLRYYELIAELKKVKEGK